MSVSQALKRLGVECSIWGSDPTNEAEYLDPARVRIDSGARPDWTAVQAELAELAVDGLYDYAAEKRWQVETGGIVFGGVPVPTHDRAKTLISGAAGSSKPDTDVIKFKAPTGWVDITVGDVRAMRDAITTHVQNCLDVEESVAALIADGTYTTNAQIDAHAWPSNS